MRVLLCTPDYPPARGGVQNLLERLARELASRHEVRVVTSSPGGDRVWDRAQGYRITRARRTPVRQAGAALLYLYTVLEAVRWRPDVMICGHILVGPACRLVRQVFGIPYIVIGHGSEMRSARMRRLAAIGLRGASYATAGSEFTRRLILQHGVSEARAILLRPGPGVDGATEPMPAHRGGDGRMLLSVSRLVERYKGHDMVIRALPLIAAKVAGVRYVIVGDGWLRSWLERLARSLGVEERVTFTGEIPDEQVDAWYRRCDVFILASRESTVGGGAEGYGLVFVEANLRGKPVIGGRSGGVPDAVIDGVTGLLVDPLDIRDIADAAVRLLTDDALAARLGSEGRRRVVEDLAWSSYVVRFTRLLDQARPAATSAA